MSSLLHDAAALYGFVDLISKYCTEQESSRVYGAASEEFFTYVRNLATTTKDFLRTATANSSKRRRWADQDRSKVALFRECWKQLHEFVKPAAEGHVLQTPSPLLTLMHDKLKQVPGLEDSRIVMLVSHKLGYYQHPHGPLKTYSEELKFNLPTATPLPGGLGFIEIPYSEADSVFTNTLIFHELGHFVFEELYLWGDLEHVALEALRTNLRTFTTAGTEEQDWCLDRLERWADETFCDLFALTLVGPAYSFAYTELFNLLGVLDEDSARKFEQEHPADGFRFREQIQLLKRSGWWDVVSKMKCEHVALMKQYGSIPMKDYHFPDTGSEVPGGDGKPLIRAFLSMRSHIRNLVTQKAKTGGSGLPLFRKKNRDIQKCLANGVVPSAIAEKDHDLFRKVIINSSSFFYLESLSKLIDMVADRSSASISDRSEMARKVEMWTMKAIEDCNLLYRQRKSQLVSSL